MPATLRPARVAEVIIKEALRHATPARIQALVELTRESGQIVPVQLVEGPEGPRLVHGELEFAAAAALGAEHVTAIVHPEGTLGSEIDILKRRIAGALGVFGVTALERAEIVLMLRTVFEAEHGKPKVGRPSKAEEENSEGLVTFSEAVGELLLLSRRMMYLHLRIATRISASLRTAIQSHAAADNQQDLLRLAAETPERQAQIVALLVSGTATVVEAIAAIDNVPPPVQLELFEKVADTFARLKPAEQHRFFDVHAEAVERWWYARKGGH